METIKKKLKQLISWSEKYTETDMTYVVGGGLWLITGKVLLFLISFFLMVAFANLLPPETYGKYQYLVAAFAILSIFALPGVNTSLVKSIALRKEGTLSFAIGEKIKWGLIASLSSVVIALWYFWRENYLLAFAFLLGALFLPLLETFQIYLYFWNGRKRFDMQTKYEVLSAFLVALTLIFALYFSDNLLVIIGAFLLGHTFFDWIFYQKTARQAANRQVDPQAISFGKHLTIMGSLAIASSHLDKILIWKFLGAAQVAVYTFAQLPIYKIMLATSLQPLALPKLGEQNIREKKADIMKKFYKLFFVFLPLALLFYWAAPLIYKIFLPQYLESVLYFKALSLMIVFMPFSLLNAALIADLRQKDLYIINTASPLLKIALFLILTPIFGIWGIVTTLLLVQAVISFLTLFYFSKL